MDSLESFLLLLLCETLTPLSVKDTEDFGFEHSLMGDGIKRALEVRESSQLRFNFIY